MDLEIESAGVEMRAGFPAPGATVRTVVLWHTRPDGSAHADWMLETDKGTDPKVRSLITFRLAQDLRAIQPEAIQRVIRIQDHRRAYLTHEGPISGGRGAVLRLSSGQATILSSNERVEMTIAWAGPGPTAPQRVLLEPQDGDSWLLTTGGAAHSA